MKRHPALHKLSHDHHHGLVMVLRLKKGGPASPNYNWPTDRAGQIDSLIHFATSELLPHFDREERHLLGIAPDLDDKVRSDHRKLRELYQSVVSGQATDPILQQFGEELEAHIRFEEREFFPQLQVILGEEGLSQLADQLNAEGREPRP